MSSEVSLSSPNVHTPLYSFYVPSSPSPPPPSPFFSSLMSNADPQLLFDVVHRQFNDAISYNLYTGLAYGRFPFCFSTLV